jgi:hypothetical protein
MRLCLFCAGIALIASCKSEKTAVIHTELGSMTVRLRADTPLPAGDSLEIEQVAQDEFIRLNDYSSSSSVRNTNDGKTEWPLSGTLVESGGAIFIVQGRKHSDTTLDRWEQLNNRKLDPNIRDQLKQKGGSLVLGGRCKIIGELTTGREVLNRIAALPTDNTGHPLRRVFYTVSLQ